MSTVLFRDRFEQTRSDETSAGPSLTLLQTPEFFADRYHLHHVEFWSPHFESLEPGYLKELKAKVKKSRSTLINIQCDEPYQIGDPDEAKRKESLDLVLRWVDAAAALGAPAIRVNPGEGQLDLAMQSYHTINAAAKKRGLILMIENHFGLATDPDVHVQMVKEIGTDNAYTLPDYGNYPDDIDRFAALEKIMPYAYQVSAKATDFNEQGDHIGFDFDRCMDIAQSSGFNGIYSVEQWSPHPNAMEDEAMGTWLVNRVQKHLAG